jgi:hypothetical protein
LITEAALAFLAGLAAAAFWLPGRRRGFLGFLADHFIEAHAVFRGELLHALQQIFFGGVGAAANFGFDFRLEAAQFRNGK